MGVYQREGEAFVVNTCRRDTPDKVYRRPFCRLGADDIFELVQIRFLVIGKKKRLPVGRRSAARVGSDNVTSSVTNVSDGD